MADFKVLVVDDSAFMRKIISDLIEKDPSFKVIGTAGNGKEALQKMEELHPDLVTMDFEMPEMNGLEALTIIMGTKPLPVIMLSGINEQGIKETIMALEAGAFDFIKKPSLVNSQDIEQVGAALLEKMNTAMHSVKRLKERKLAEEQQSVNAVAEAAEQQPKETITPRNERLADSADRNSQREEPAADQPAAASRTVRAEDKPDGGVKASKPAESKPFVQPSMRPEGSKPLTNSSSAAARPAVKRSLPTEPARPVKEPPAYSKTFKSAGQPSAAARNEKGQAARTIPSSASAHAVPAGREPSPVKSAGSTSFTKLVAVGCSTGGPRALKTLLEHIPAHISAPVVIVQHMPPNFTHSLAQRLNSISPLRVLEAADGMALEAGTAYIAPGGLQLKVLFSGGRYVFNLSNEEPRNGHRPSVDTMFESLMPLTSLERHLVLLTGMGSDGAKMMKKLYDEGVTSTFAESEDTCVVYGMPRSAVELNCVRYLLPLQEIAPKLVQVVK
ncbi:chemotaxis protein CheB [Paenibacillus sp. JX-17]|uniref:Protein-glutamate methylesterase/protein-glutamine glutaminase n=1 Tax=Paenibacillus lacisoli TaxID=3064525 RepID=A0ABT9CB87_9BACL|nr:chemotaxis protein CheB [Paenibacillus sp. JX-17]MDO7905813.1 chemotaxis protein CheB [Paenibacillus sp. JX-17]